MLKSYFKVAEDQTRRSKENQRKNMRNEKKSENKVQKDRNEILKVCTRFYTEVYRFYTPRPTPITKEYQPKHVKSPNNNDIMSQKPEEKEKNTRPPA